MKSSVVKIFKLSVSVLALVSFAACSSKGKTEVPAPLPKPAAAPAAAETASAPASEGQKKVIHSGKAKADKSAEKGAEKSPEKKATSAEATEGTVTCTHGSDVRTVEVKSVGSGCEVIYSKGGEAKTVADAKNDKGFCATKSEKLQKNLEGAGFDCK